MCRTGKNKIICRTVWRIGRSKGSYGMQYMAMCRTRAMFRNGRFEGGAYRTGLCVMPDDLQQKMQCRTLCRMLNLDAIDSDV